MYDNGRGVNKNVSQAAKWYAAAAAQGHAQAQFFLGTTSAVTIAVRVRQLTVGACVVRDR
jgi:hypothetical protein